MSLLTLTDENFKKEVIETDKPTLVDFWADWCAPCKIQGPIIKEIAKEYEGKNIKIAKMDVTANPNTPAQYQIMSIPTLIIFNSGKPIETLVGIQNKNVLKKKLDSLVS